MRKIKILQGIPASGKTTWATKYILENPDWVRVNRDDLRWMRGKYWIPKQEKLITKWEHSLVITALQDGYNVILDAINLNDDRIQSFIDKLKSNVSEIIDVEIIPFTIDLDTAIERDKKREHPVGEDVITRMYNNFTFGKK